jgi:3-oxoacyl-[acyl-carrier-protein] synthase II
MTDRPRVVVTGLGATTPLGGDVASTWSALLAGKSGVRTLEAGWAQDLPVRIGAPVAVDPSEILERVRARTLDRSQQLALIAAQEAWADAGTPTVDGERLAVVIASGIGGIVTLISAYDTFREHGPRRVSPHTIPMLMPNGPAATVGLALGARAGVHTPVSACASGSEAVAVALDILRAGRADVVVCGGTEAAIHVLPVLAFHQMRALSIRNDEPERASRPFDKARDGFVMGEGAGVLVLETEAHAKARGAKVYAELAGAGLTSDAHHIAAPEPTGAGAARAIVMALRDAELDATDVKHINAHATSTPLGDIAESLALRTSLGSALDGIPVTASKSMTGHLLGAAGAVEAVATVLAIQQRVVPPTINLDDVDDEIDLDLVRLDQRPLPPGAAISNSFGFGGHNVTLAFREA